MSKRSLSKRRHRPDFQEYLGHRAANKATAHLWKQYGFPDNTTFQVALKQAMVEQAAKLAEAGPSEEVKLVEVIGHDMGFEDVTVEQGETHVHGSSCHHG